MSTEDLFFLHFRKIVAVAVGLGGLAVFGLVGCPEIGDSDGSMSGQVTSGGKPVRWGTVTVIGTDNRGRTATIQPDGTYSVRGLPPGPVRVMVNSADPNYRLGGSPRPAGGRPSPGPSGGASARPLGADSRQARKLSALSMDAEHPVAESPTGGNAPAGWFPIPGKYADPATSGITAQVGDGSVQFDIKAD